jgi:hypothetical protein
MALNQRAINEEVINGGPVQRNVILVAYIYVNQVYTYVSGAINSFFLNANSINSASTQDAYLNASITKQFNKNLLSSVLNTVTLISGFAFGKVLSVVSTSSLAITKAISTTKEVTSIVTATLSKLIDKFISDIQIVTAVILTATNRLITLLAYSSSSVSITKAISKILPLVTSSVIGSISFIKSLLRTITASVSSTVTLLSARFYYRDLSVISTVTALLQNTIVKTLTISVNCGIILSKLINKYINATSTAIASLLANAISFTNYPVDRLIYAADRLREVTVIKFRTIFIDKDTRV